MALNQKQREVIKLDYLEENLHKIGLKIRYQYTLVDGQTGIGLGYHYAIIRIAREAGRIFRKDQIDLIEAIAKSHVEYLGLDWKLKSITWNSSLSNKKKNYADIIMDRHFTPRNYAEIVANELK